MTSLGPYSQKFALSHMDRIIGVNTYTQNNKSIAGVIKTHSDFTKFRHILAVSGMGNLFDHQNSEITVFVPSDKYLQDVDVTTIDRASARHIVKSSTLKRKIPSEVIKHSPFSYYHTNHPMNRLFIRNTGDNTTLNSYINIVEFDVVADNGLIHVTDTLIDPIRI